MRGCVTVGAKCDEILLYIPSRMAPKLDVMYLQVFHAAASLASPPIALHNLTM